MRNEPIFDALSFWIERVLALAFAAAVILSFVNVIGRYGFGVGVMWADEVQIYIMIWMAFLGAVVVTWRRVHLRMDLFFKMLPAPMQRFAQLLELVTLITLAGVVVFLSTQDTYNMLALGRLSDAAQVPMWIPHSGIALGFSLTLLIALLQLWQWFFKPMQSQSRWSGNRFNQDTEGPTKRLLGPRLLINSTSGIITAKLAVRNQNPETNAVSLDCVATLLASSAMLCVWECRSRDWR